MCSLATESVGLEAGLENECKPLTINDSALKDTGNDPKAIPLIPERSASPIITITPPDSERRVRLTITSEHTWIASQALNPLGGPHHNSKAGLRPLSSSNSCPDTRRMSFPAPVRVLSRKSSLCFSVKSASGPGELTERLIVTRDSRDGFLTPEYRRREPSRRASTSLCSTPTPSSSRFAGSSSQSSPLTDFALTVQSPVHRPTRAGDSTRPLDRLFNRRYSTDGSLSLLNLSCAEKRAISTGLEKDDVIAEQRRKGYRRTSSASEANIRNDETGESSSTETVIRPKRWAWDVMHPEERVCATHDQDEVLSSVEIEAMEVLVPVREPSGFYFREVGETIRAAGPVPSVVVGLGGATEGHYERNIEGRFNKEHRRKLKSRSSVVYRFFTSVPQQDGNSSTDTLSSVGQRTPFRVLTHKISTNVLRFIGGSTSPLLHQSTESSLWNIPDETEENVRKQKKAYRSSEGNKANPNDPNGKKPFWHYPLDKHIERAQQTKKKSRKIHGTSVILYFRKLTKGIFTKNAKQETVPEPGVAEVDGATPPTEDIIGEMLGEPEFGEPRLGEGSMHLEENFPRATRRRKSYSAIWFGQGDTLSNGSPGPSMNVSWTSRLQEFGGSLGHVQMSGNRPISDQYSGSRSTSNLPNRMTKASDRALSSSLPKNFRLDDTFPGTSFAEDMKDYETAPNEASIMDEGLYDDSEEAQDSEGTEGDMVDANDDQDGENEYASSTADSDEDMKLQAMLHTEGRVLVLYGEDKEEDNNGPLKSASNSFQRRKDTLGTRTGYQGRKNTVGLNSIEVALSPDCIVGRASPGMEAKRSKESTANPAIEETILSTSEPPSFSLLPPRGPNSCVALQNRKDINITEASHPKNVRRSSFSKSSQFPYDTDKENKSPQVLSGVGKINTDFSVIKERDDVDKGIEPLGLGSHLRGRESEPDGEEENVAPAGWEIEEGVLGYMMA